MVAPPREVEPSDCSMKLAWDAAPADHTPVIIAKEFGSSTWETAKRHEFAADVRMHTPAHSRRALVALLALHATALPAFLCPPILFPHVPLSWFLRFPTVLRPCPPALSTPLSFALIPSYQPGHSVLADRVLSPKTAAGFSEYGDI